MKLKFCDVCRAPAALMPCSRCVLPGPHPSTPSDPERQSRPTRPILLEGKYRLLEELGRGGMGTVFRAMDEILERPVAIKFLLPEIQATPAAVERFRREAKAMASISDQNVVRVFSFGRYGAADFIVTEYVDGPTLEDMIDAAFRRGEQIPIAQAVEILVQAAKGLHAVHEAGVVHRDIKPGNIMFEPDTGRALIMDFGIGRRVTREAETSTVAPGGTPAYMAPEIIASREINTLQEHLIDIYAFGVTAFEFLTSRLPFDGDTWIEVLEKHLEMTPPRPSELRAEIPEAFDELIQKSMRKTPHERFQSAAELGAALAASKGEHEATERRSPRSRPSALPEQRRLHTIVADEDPAFRGAVFELIRKHIASSVSSATSAAQALESLDRDQRVLFIAELHDRSLNGLELAATMSHEMDEGRAALILTADRITPAEEHLLGRLGPVHVVQRSLIERDMAAVVERALRSLGVEDRPVRQARRSAGARF